MGHAAGGTWSGGRSALLPGETRLAVCERAGLDPTVPARVTDIEALAGALDPATRAHLERACRYAVWLARVIDPDLAGRPEVVWGFRLHDIGKVLIPDAILGKPGPLSVEEWGVVRQHPEVGARLLRLAGARGEAAAVARYHHERYDGTGYPYGLAGREIPLPARIFAVADAFEAMTSDRPYRRRQTTGWALEELARHAGTQFDPHVVEAFLALAAKLGLAGTDRAPAAS